MKPQRITLSRKAGWRMPANTVKVTRPGKFGNPFKIGGYFMVGDPIFDPAVTFRMAWCQALNKEVADRTPGKFTLIENSEQAVAMFRQLVNSGHFRDVSELKGKNLACWCKQGAPCHADVLLELANA